MVSATLAGVAERADLGLLDVEAVKCVAGRGRPGSDILRRALDKHLPELGYAVGVRAADARAVRVGLDCRSRR